MDDLYQGGLLVTGTDTGVGKTVVTAAVAYNLAALGLSVAVMKPVQTGTAEGHLPDVLFCYGVLGKRPDLGRVCPYMFRAPLAPMVAARLEGAEVDPARIGAVYGGLLEENDVVLVEGAGGVKVPLREGYFFSDLARDLSLGALVVARPSLGTINHTLLTLEHLERASVTVAGVVINDFPSDPDVAARTNPALLGELTPVEIVGVCPHDDSIEVETGRVGALREAARTALAPRFGGTFSLKGFLSELARC